MAAAKKTPETKKPKTRAPKALTKETEAILTQGKADKNSLLPPGVAAGAVSRSEYVNLLIVEFVERQEKLLKEKKEELEKGMVAVESGFTDIYEATKNELIAVIDKNGLTELKNSLKKLTGKDQPVWTTLDEKLSFRRDHGQHRFMPEVRSDGDCGRGYEGRDSVRLLDIVYFQVFGQLRPHDHKDRGKQTKIGVLVTIGKRQLHNTEDEHHRMWGMPPGMLEAMFGDMKSEVEVLVDVPVLSLGQASVAADLRAQDAKNKELRSEIARIADTLQNPTKLEKKALAVMTAEALGPVERAKLPQIEMAV